MNLGVQLAVFLVCWQHLDQTSRIVCLVVAIISLLGWGYYGDRWPAGLLKRG